MQPNPPFLLKNVAALRERIERIERGEAAESREAKLWELMKHCARTSPDGFPWFTPFVALMTRESGDIERAKGVLADYIRKLEPMYFTSGLQYHFWCFSFPHAKWCMYFQWLTTIGAYTNEEAADIRGRLIGYHFLNFFYGMRTKPEPDCVDNQALSLCLSNALVGRLFSGGDDPSEMAARMLEEGLRRLPAIIGGMPASGYTGEGSSYMDCVVGPAIPLAVELIEEIAGETDAWTRPFPPNGVVPAHVLRMVAREWMPGGLLLPWDNYGYQYGVRASLAYAARRTGDAACRHLLEREAIWSYDIGTGWAYDDLVWTWIWWPPDDVRAGSGSDGGGGERAGDGELNAGGSGGGGLSDGELNGGESNGGEANDGELNAGGSVGGDYRWSDADVGGVITAQGSDYYLMQMWDDSEPVYPARSHVNPNAVLFNAYGVPLSLDGESRTCERFRFPDTWREVKYSLGAPTRYNYGDGCGGAHSVLLVDGWEGMRASGRYAQHRALELNHSGGALCADVTPMYAETFPDARRVRRRSSVAADRFFVIEDWADFGGDHRFTSRFVLRPELVPAAAGGAKIQTREGVTLHLVELLGGTATSCETIDGDIYYYPMDRKTLLVDFAGASGRRLFVAFPSRAFAPADSEADWRTICDPDESLDWAQAAALLDASPHIVPFRHPAYMEQALPIVRRWWYRKRLRKRSGPAWLRLPRGMHEARCRINGREAALEPNGSILLAPVVAVPDEFAGETELDVIVRCDVPVSHFDGKGEGTVGLNGAAALCYPCREETIVRASYADGRIRVETNERHYEWPYRLMEEETHAADL